VLPSLSDIAKLVSRTAGQLPEVWVLVRRSYPNDSNNLVKDYVLEHGNGVFEVSVADAYDTDWTTLIPKIESRFERLPQIKFVLDPSIAPLLTLAAPDGKLSKDEWRAYGLDALTRIIGEPIANFDIEIEICQRQSRFCGAHPSELRRVIQARKNTQSVYLFQYAWNLVSKKLSNSIISNAWGLLSCMGTIQPFQLRKKQVLLFPSIRASIQSAADLEGISASLASLNISNEPPSEKLWIELGLEFKHAIHFTDGWVHLPTLIAA
jgi:hypothetical protein